MHEFSLPAQTRDRLSACDHHAQALGRWLDQLPVANVGETARQLFQLVTELTQLAVPPGERLALTELVRPRVRFTLQALEKHFLNQPVILPPQARQIARLAHAMQTRLAQSYMIAAVQSTGQPASLADQALAIQRALDELSGTVLRHAQLYSSVPAALWQDIHRLFQLADDSGVLSRPVEDGARTSSPEQAYLRVLLLGCMNTNQLRQADLHSIYQALADWAPLASLRATPEGCLFGVDTAGGSPPRHTDLLPPPWGASLRGISTNALVRQLESLRTHSNPGLRDALLGHLLHAWGAQVRRHFARSTARDTLELCVGLSAIHFHTSGGIPFSLFVMPPSQAGTSTRDNPFQGRPSSNSLPVRDVWNTAFDAPREPQKATGHIDFHPKTSPEVETTGEAQRYPTLRVRTVNTSPGGFCLGWDEEMPTQVRTGELAGVREPGQQAWRLAVVRWVRLVDDTRSEAGLELISPSVTPYGARVLQKTGEQGDFLRALLLPEQPVIRQPATLVTPSLAFRKGQKVTLIQRGQQSQALLTGEITATNAFTRFEFQPHGLLPDTLHGPDSENTDSFNIPWHKL